MLSYAVAKFRPHSTNSGTLAIAQVDGGNSVGLQFTNGAGSANWDMSLQPFGGNVGINKINPAGALHVYSGTSERFLVSGDVHVQGATDLNINGTSRRLSFTNGNGTIRTTNATELYLQTNSTTAVTIDANQNVSVVGTLSASSIGNWNTAYGWGNHASAGYITGYSEVDTLATVTSRGSSTATSVRFSNDLNYFGKSTGNNEGEIVINTGIAGSPQIGFTEHGDASWAIGIDDADNSFKIHGSGTATIPSINGLAIPLFEVTTTAGVAYLNNNRIHHAGDFSTTNVANGVTAYGWGDHSTAGYISSFTNTNEFVTGATFNSSNGVITFTRNNGGDTFTVDLDGRYLTSVTNIGGYSGTLLAQDNRTISPSELSANLMKFGFTSWDNNNSGPYADFLHLRSYGDSSGGADNLVMFKKSGIGMRIWQQTYGSATAYSSYEDVWTTGGITTTQVSNWDTAYGWGNHSGLYLPINNPTLTGVLTLPQHLKATGSNLSFSAGGNQILNIDLNGKIYPQTDNTVDLGFSTTGLRFRAGNFSGVVTASGGNSTNWNTAYGWGDHSTEGYVTGNYLPIVGGTLTGDLTVGSTSRASNTVIKALSGDSNRSGFEAYGSSQGNGYLYVGQSTTHGGGISYNGDNSPAFVNSESADRITFYRRTAGVNSEVFSYNHNSDSVYFNGEILPSTINTGQGSTEVHLMNQNIRTTDSPTFASINTGQGATEVHLMNQNIRTTDDVQFGKGKFSEQVSVNNRTAISVAHWGASSNTTGAIKIKVPGTHTSNWSMFVLRITTYEYNSNAHAIYYVSGHDWTSGWYQNGVTVQGSGKALSLGFSTGANEDYIILGDVGSTWQYGHVTVDVVVHPEFYSSSMDITEGWSITQETDLAGITINSVTNKQLLDTSNYGTNISQLECGIWMG